ncbi:MAG: hypothetical protein A3H28_10315 [Acidobacteria bacterium RIFCSPLOWO2_02_FULL_61_28]|nr:MAG: hypothetical protein A3H28_10315 [Acidobacteria bacterium RIFCSPLOWO2_02_FULL_61_28]
MFMPWMKSPALVILSLLFAAAVYGNIDYEDARRERRLKPAKTGEKITIDGRLDEPAWNQAPEAANFIQTEPDTDQPASEKTEVRALYDQDYIYFGIYAHDSQPSRIIVSELKKDFNRDNGDTVEIVLDTFRDERNGYLFAINPAGAKWDGQMANEGREINANWDAVWYVKTRRVEDGWTAEIAIPFRTLKFRESDLQTWGINFQRNLRRRNEDSFWSPLPRIYRLDRVSLAGTLEDLERIKPGSNIRIKPYFVTSLGQPFGGRDIPPGTEKTISSCRWASGANCYHGDFGIDLKYGLTTGMTWDFTYNTDFSQVEADEQQINLTRFSLLFPEKREFFLENSGIFQFGSSDRAGPPPGTGGGGGGGGPRPNAVRDDLIFFFSRRIGLSEDGNPIPILGGTRLTGRAGRFELGLLNMQQKEFGSFNATNFTVARLRRNLLANSDIGVLLVNKKVFDSSHYNTAIGVDANFRFGQSVTLNSYLAKSFTERGGDRDLAGRFAASYKDNVWDLRSSFTSIQQDFVNETGFVPRVGIRKYSGYIARTFRPASLRRTVRQIWPHVLIDYVLDRDGNLETRYVDYHLPINFQNGGNIEMGANPTLERLPRPFVISRGSNVLIPTGVYSFNEWFVSGRSNPGRRISGNFRYAIGDFYTGYKHTYGLGGTFRFSNKFNTSFNFTHNNINLPQGHFKTNLLTTRVDYSFSTDMFLNALIQYNNDARQWSSNIRFNLIHRPLSDLFVVFNERRNSISGDLIDRALIAKFTYMIAR